MPASCRHPDRSGPALDEIDHTVEVNLQSVLWLTRVLLPRLRASKAGHVIFNASTAAHAPAPILVVYAATKAAISAFATSLPGQRWLPMGSA